jgi:hypothetical protein
VTQTAPDPTTVVGTISDTTGTTAGTVAGTISDTTGTTTGSVSDATGTASTTVAGVTDGVSGTSVSDAAGMASGLVSDTTMSAVQVSAGGGSSSEGTRPGDPATMATYSGTGQSTSTLTERASGARIRLLANVDRNQAEVPIAPPDTPGACQDAFLCTLTVGVSGVGALVRTLASIIRSLAFTGYGGLTLMALSLVLAVAGALALTEARRRSSGARVEEAPAG